MIPELNEDGNLPPGVHAARLAEVEARFSGTEVRRALFRGLKEALRSLGAAGCRRFYLNGSFVTAKAEPGDFDACWDPRGVDPDLLDPVLLDFEDSRRAQKQRYGGEMFPSTAKANPEGAGFLDFFQKDRDEEKPKGILLIDPSEIQDD